MDEVLKPQSKAKFSNNFDTFEKTGQNTKEQITQINSMKLRIQQYELDKQRTKQQFDDHVQRYEDKLFEIDKLIKQNLEKCNQHEELQVKHKKLQEQLQLKNKQLDKITNELANYKYQMVVNQTPLACQRRWHYATQHAN